MELYSYLDYIVLFSIARKRITNELFYKKIKKSIDIHIKSDIIHIYLIENLFAILQLF